MLPHAADSAEYFFTDFTEPSHSFTAKPVMMAGLEMKKERYGASRLLAI
jgi:hypothetical protein